MTRAAFMALVRKGGGPKGQCWIWLGNITLKGYGWIWVPKKRRMMTASRLAWEVFRGEIPAGIWVLHRCDVRACVRPSHLYLGRAAENNADTIDRHLSPRARGEEHWKRKLTDDRVISIRNDYAAGRGLVELASFHGVDRTTIRAIVRRKTWKHVA